MPSNTEKLRLLQDDNPFLRSRLRQIFWASQLALIAGILNLVLFSENLIEPENLFGIRVDIIALMGAFIATYLAGRLLECGKLLLAGSLYLWVCSIALIFITWMEGGLYSLIILCFPVVLIFAALLTEFRVFIAMSSFLTIALLLMGLNHIYDWYAAPSVMFITGYPRVLSGVIVMLLTSYIAWIFGELLRLSMLELKRENNRVNESKDVIRKLAEFDNLTGLMNRGAARLAYDKLIANLNSHEKIVFYFIDLDNFKSINDLFDHHEGDRLLVSMANRLEGLLGADDLSCRLGGDEFIIIVRANQFFDLDEFAKKLLSAVTQPYDIYGTNAEVTASIGVAVINQSGLSFDDVRKKADMAMYQAKQSGKNQYHYYSAELDKEYMRNLSIVTGLKDAVGKGLLDLHYQPKINLANNRAECAEALLRWTRDNPEGIRPDEFIPVIESTELIHDVGAWVINEACKDCKQFHEKGFPIKMSVNVAAMQLTRQGFYDVVVDALEASGLAPEFLEIELTEHFLLNENHVVESQIDALKKLGVSLAIDDFGAGYSNMSYLTRLKVDVLKLDRSFISQICQSSESLVIVTAVIKMAKVLGMQVVAEGIEQEEEQALLVDLNCDYGQGFLWSKAVPHEEFITFLGKWFAESPKTVVLQPA